MLKIVPNPTFEVLVRLSVPGTDAPASVRIVFVHKSKKELALWIASAIEATDDADYLLQVIRGWDGVVALDGSPVPFNADNLRALLEAYPSAGGELVLAYRRNLADARQKN